MESESAGAAGPARDEPILFISDASAEAERLTLALRARGHVVADVPLALLAGRVAVQRPALVLCDADAESATETIRRIRSIPSDVPLAIVLLGERDGTIGRIDVTLVDAVFARPVNVQELVGTVERLIGIGPNVGAHSSPPSVRSTKMAASSRPPGRSSPSASAGPRLSERPARPDAGHLAGAVPLPPDLAGDGPAPREASSDAPVVELSGDIQLLLLSAERRLGDDRPVASSGAEEPGPEVDVDAPLPAEVLSALEEPLDDEDESEKTGIPDREAGTFGGKTGQRGHTTNAGTSGTGLGTDGAGTPPSEGSFPGAAKGLRTSVRPLPDVAPEALALPEEEEAEEGEGRRARQQASTPRPPKPGAEDLKSTAPPEADKRSLPPPTAVENPIPDPPSRRAWDREVSSMRMPSRSGTIVEPRDVPQDRDAREELSSTTPPLRGSPADERGTDRPGPGEPSPQRRSEHPKGHRESDRPSSPQGGRRETDRPSAPDAAPAEPLSIPSVLRQGDAVAALARAIRTRYTGAVAFEVDEGIRRIVLRDGDFVTAASGVHGESLVLFLASRGDLALDVARQAHKLPPFGRRAGAALIAHGHLAQDQLWPVLRAHAEWIIGRVVVIDRGSASVEDLGRLHDEPAVFGGATGAEVLVEVVRRVVGPEDAIERLGGLEAVLALGASRTLLAECALSAAETERVQRADGSTIRNAIEGSPDPSVSSALYALVALGVLVAEGARPKAAVPDRPLPEPDELDEEAFRAKILSRKALVDDGDYFAVLGVPRDATGYDIRRAYTVLRREFEPSRVLTVKSADLGDMVGEIVEVLEEAYEILSDQRRRDRYRRAIEATP